MKFLDQAKIYIRSGDGGAGCVSFRREKYVEFGGPDGGNGGQGGHVIAKCVSGLNTLIDYRYQQHFKASKGEHGKGKNRTGANGKDKILKLPVGTQILAADKQKQIADLTTIGQTVMLLRGGKGGFGNTHFKGPTQQAPRHANPGQEGQEAWLWLRLKLIADIGLIGLPNVGKSTFLAAVSQAKPKIADYPFTTLHPNLGVAGAKGQEFVIADIPGLIAGASAGAGLGHRFLGHIERCTMLLHLLDGRQDNIVANYQTIRQELAAYGQIEKHEPTGKQGLTEKYEMLALNKCDLLDDNKLAAQCAALEAASGVKPFIISAATGQGIDALLAHMVDRLDKMRQATHINTHEKAQEAKAQEAWYP